MSKQKEQPAQIQLELPDYSKMYYEYMQKKEQENKQEDTVVIIDIY
jgi:hypothetical protein